MRTRMRVSVLGFLVALGLAGLLVAPAAAAGCNDSSGTTVCAQGEIRGTDAPPLSAPERGSYGTFCQGGLCYSTFGGIGIFAP